MTVPIAEPFIRLWCRHVSWYRQYGDEELRARPLAWQRTGPGTALDGQPKFDLTKFDPEFFRRLRTRVEAAGNRGICVSIMLFGGHHEAGPGWEGNPFHRDNNVNGIDGDPDGDGQGWETHTLSERPEAVGAVQKAFVRKIVDTVNDLDNVIYEIPNDGEIRGLRDEEGACPGLLGPLTLTLHLPLLAFRPSTIERRAAV